MFLRFLLLCGQRAGSRSMLRLWIFMALAIVCGERKLVRAAQNDPAATIRQQYTDWLRAYEQKDLAGTMEIFAPDCISTLPGAADSDVNAMRQSYEKSFATVGPSRKWKPIDLEIGASGDLAYTLADWQLFEVAADGAAN